MHPARAAYVEEAGPENASGIDLANIRKDLKKLIDLRQLTI